MDVKDLKNKVFHHNGVGFCFTFDDEGIMITIAKTYNLEEFSLTFSLEQKLIEIDCEFLSVTVT